MPTDWTVVAYRRSGNERYWPFRWCFTSKLDAELLLDELEREPQWLVAYVVMPNPKESDH